MYMWLSLPVLLLARVASAHFILHWPPTAGFDDDKEATEPCGSFTPDIVASSPDVQVDRFAILIQNVHPVGQWSFRATTDTKPPYAFEEIVPVINTTGIGDFCLDYMRAKDSFAGKPGIIQVVDNSPDGILYQCAPVNFVAGSNTSLGSSCANASGFDAVWTQYSGFRGEKPAPSGNIATGLLASTSSTSTSNGQAAAATGFGQAVAGLCLLAAGLVL